VVSRSSRQRHNNTVVLVPDENAVQPPVVNPSDALDFYKSLQPESRDRDREFVLSALDNNICPDTIRYDEFRGSYRGVIKALDGETYYFVLPPTNIFHVVKADNEDKRWEAERILKSCKHGCDLQRALEDKEDEKKGDITGLPPASLPEQQMVQDQTQVDAHPGAAGGQTPEQDGSSDRWHGDGKNVSKAVVIPDLGSVCKSLSMMGQELQETAPKLNHVDQQMKQFMVEVMGKMPEEVDAGHVSLNSLQRAEYNRWLTKSLRGRMSGLANWLKKGQ
jgi:hypothetical protein